MPSGDHITDTYDSTKDQIKDLQNSKEEQLDLIAVFKEWKIIIRRIEDALSEYDKGSEEYIELTNILEKAIHEYNELELEFIRSKQSENNISATERKSIMLELSDIIDIDEQHKDITDEFRIWYTLWGLWELIWNGASNKRVENIVEESMNLRENDTVRKREKEAKELVQNANTTFNEAFKKELEWDTLYQTAFKEELVKQKKEFNQSYYQYLDGNIEIEDLKNEMNDIELLNIDMLTEALFEWASYFFWDLFSSDEPNLPEMKKRLWKMNLIYLASRANDLDGTDTFKEERDEVAEKIIALEKKEWVWIWRHETVWAITYNTNEIKTSINNWSHEDIDKYKLYFYLENEHENFSNETISQLLTEYPREFVRYISGQFLNEKGIMSALLWENNKDFLIHLKDIDNVINLKNSNNLNNATEDLNKNEVQNAKKELLSSESRSKFIEKIKTVNPEELNQVMQELRIFAIQQTIIENKHKFIIEIETENWIEKSEELFKKVIKLAPEIAEKWIYGNDLIAYIIKNVKNDSENFPCEINNDQYKSLIKTINEWDLLAWLTLAEIQWDRAFSIPWDNEEQFNSYMQNITSSPKEVSSTIQKIDTLNNKEFDQFIEMVADWNSFNEIDIYFSEINEEYKKNLNKIRQQERKETTLNSDNTEDSNVIIFQNYSLDKDPQNPSIETQDWKKIPIDWEEAKMVQNNPDAMENIVNFFKFFTELNLWSAWELRTQLALAMWVSNINLHDDWLKESELIAYGNKLLQVMNNLDPKSNSLNTNNNTISSLKSNFNEYTWTKSILSANKSHGLQWEDKFKYDLRMCGIYSQNHWIQINNFRKQTKKEA